jgi:hypothetical protein
MTRLIFESLPELVNAHAAGKEIKLETAATAARCRCIPARSAITRKRADEVGASTALAMTAAFRSPGTAGISVHGQGTTDMLQAEGGKEPVKVEFDNFEHGFPAGFGPGGWGYLAYAIGIVLCGLPALRRAFNYLPSQVVRGVHVGFLLLMTFGLIGNFTAKSDFGRRSAADGGAGFLCGLYQWIFYADLIARDGDPTRADLVVGTLLAVLIFEGTRRLMGLALPLMCGACLLYWFFGQYLPQPFNHRGYDFDQVITHLSFGTEGFYGVPIYVSATYIFLFILFGSFLERAGMIQLFHRRLARPVRPRPRRAGQGRGVRLRHDGNDLRLRRRQCRHRRPVHDSADDQVRLSPRLCRRRRGHRLDGRTDHAAGDGRGRLHHGRDARGAIFRDRQGGGDSGHPVFRLRVLDGASGSRQARPRRHEAFGNPERVEGAGARWYLVLPLVALVYMLFEGFTPLYAGSMGLR